MPKDSSATTLRRRTRPCSRPARCCGGPATTAPSPKSRSFTGRATTTGHCPRARSIAGESEPITAVREVAEETGYSGAPRQAADIGELSASKRRASRRCGTGRPRTVDGEFTPNDEVDELKWLPVSASDEAASSIHTTVRCCAGSPSCPPTPRPC